MYIVLSHSPWLLALTLEIIWFLPHYTVDWQCLLVGRDSHITLEI